MDESGHRSGAGHGVGEPDIERNLSRFSGCANQQQQRDGGENSNARFHWQAVGRIKYFREIERAKLPEDQKDGERKSEVANAIDDKCLVASGSSELLGEVEPDQQIAAQPHAFPADEQQQVILRQDQHQHEKHEEVQVGEEAVVAAFMLHVADGVDVNQRPHARHHHQHDGSEAVHCEIDSDIQRSTLDPGEVVLDVFGFKRAQAQQGLHHPGERERHRADGEGIDQRFRNAPAEEPVREEPEQRKDGNQPEVHLE